ncbi:two-partner secretion domain-containing protein, partial [Belnapia rosea]|uniref:two-partner secretion domain-containing protein n=1 Tax=Belnapia rosea TaxID=938405 RepID=UPI0008907D3C
MAASGWTCPGLLRAWLLGTTALLPAAGALAQGVAPNALPAGGQVAAGSAAITQSGTTMQVRQTTDRAAINWQSFNIGSNASVKFQQPAATSWTLNRVTGPDPSVIAGRMTANGGIAVVNQSGVVFAQGAQVNVGSLIASAANITNENFMAGRMVFDGAPKPGATVENHGSITVADRGLAALVGPRVGNTGTIRARLGRVALQGAETYSLDLAGDGLLSIDVTQAVRSAGNGTTALVTNSGVIEAKGGSVLISAHAASGLVEDLVRNTGRINADTAAGRRGQVALRAEGGGVRVEGAVQATGRGARQRGGTIEAVATGNVTIARGAVLDASGGAGGGRIAVGVDASSAPGSPSRRSLRTAIEQGATLRANATARGNGGQVLVNSEGQTTMRGAIEARGGAQSGDGGLIEISGKGGFDVAGTVDLSAQAGRRGALLLDPERIVVDSADNIAAPAGDGDTNLLTGGVTPITAAGSSGTLYIAAPVITTLLGAADLTLQADRSITFNAGAGSISNAGTAFSHGLSLTVTAATALATDGIFLNNTDIKAASLNLSSRNGTAAAGTISIGAALTATGDVTIASENVLIGGAVAGNNVTVTAGDTVSNAGVILAHRDLGVTAGGSIRNGQGLLGGAADSAGAWMLAETGRLVVTATAGDVQNLGQMVSTAGTGSAVLAATVLDMSRGGVILLGDARREAAGAG